MSFSEQAEKIAPIVITIEADEVKLFILGEEVKAKTIQLEDVYPFSPRPILKVTMENINPAIDWNLVAQHIKLVLNQ
jgi:hypothetical protein